VTKLAYRHQRPHVGKPYSPPLLSRPEIERLIAGTFAGSHPATPSIIDDILSLQAAMACIDARRDADGKISPRDQRDWDMYDGPRAQKYRIIGLYPADEVAV
jgi:hypothetical protein